MSIWGDIPSWVVAFSTTGAFVAAGLAARWTAKTVTSASEQADAAREQVAAANEQLDVVREQLALARADADREREVAQAAERRFLRAQLDARMPVVYAKATLGCDLPEYTSGAAYGSWGRPALAAVLASEWLNNQQLMRSRGSEVTEKLTIRDPDPPMMFELTVTVEFINCSDAPARIAITSCRHWELSLSSGRELLVPPRESRHAVGIRRFGSQLLKTQEMIDSQEANLFHLEFLVRDLAHTVYDSYMFNNDLQFFSRDGSRLLVEAAPHAQWKENYAGRFGERAYEQLDA